MDKKQAEKLWASLSEALANVDRLIEQIIAARAWEPLGYDTFAAAWNDRMSGTRLGSGVLKARVLYAFYEDGLDSGEALSAAGYGSGVGPEIADYLHEQYERGVPVELARPVRVRRYDRRKPSEAKVVRIEVGPDRYSEYERIAHDRGSSLPAEAAKALEEWFKC